MTIDETIEKEKRLAVANCDMAEIFHSYENILEEEKYKDRATYHAQMAEWLSELKIHRENTSG